jgi:hypothetical protein
MEIAREDLAGAAVETLGRDDFVRRAPFRGRGAGVTRPILLYGFDPLCGWCYGIAPAVRAVAAAFPGLEIRLVMAGLVTGDRVGPDAAMEGHIRTASDRL